jgi:hypothetical protein
LVGRLGKTESGEKAPAIFSRFKSSAQVTNAMGTRELSLRD